jgi:hypothetical protein
LSTASTFEYPDPDIQVVSLDEAFGAAYPRPPSSLIASWPPAQAEYLRVYLNEIGGKTAIIEHHYIDRVFMHDDAVFYVRNLRSYPNYTKRIHFFAKEFTQTDWRAMIVSAANGNRETVQHQLLEQYLGFTVVRPLPDCPVGRTVLPASVTRAPTGTASRFGAVRRHSVHLAGFTLRVDGVPFQQQDQGVSACATTALWSALDSVAGLEETASASPASITESATRYPLQEGRPFPTEGLTVRQICEATRAAGFSPLVIRGTTYPDDRIQIFSYIGSGFSPVLALVQTEDDAAGHAVCAVGMRCGSVATQTDPNLNYQEESTKLLGLYIHDDRLGPYAFAALSGFTDKNRKGIVRTSVAIEWPDKTPDKLWLLHAMVVPVPQKLRLTVTRMRRLGLIAADAIGAAVGDRQTTLNCRYELGRGYQFRSYEFGLSDDGIYQLACRIALSRLVGLIEIGSAIGPLIDVILDTTEANPESSVLACVRRSAALDEDIVRAIADYLGAPAVC